MRDSRLQAGTLLTQKVYPPCPCALLVPSNNGSCHLLRGLMTERLSEHLFRGLMTDRSREAPRGGGDGVRNKCSLKRSVMSLFWQQATRALGYWFNLVGEITGLRGSILFFD